LGSYVGRLAEENRSWSMFIPASYRHFAPGAEHARRGNAASLDNTLVFVALALHVSTGFASTQSEYYGEQVPGWPPTRTVFLSDTTRYLNVTRREKFDQSQPARQQRAGLCFGVFDG